jgi:hypothetical protein
MAVAIHARCVVHPPADDSAVVLPQLFTPHIVTSVVASSMRS